MGIIKDELSKYLAGLQPIVSKPKTDVAASDYTASKSASGGVPVNAQWRDGKVSVGGILIEPTRVVDGKAIVDQGDVDRAVEELKKATGIQSGTEILKKYEKYKDMYDNQLDKLTNRNEFSYDADNDAVFQSYKQQYNRESNRSAEDSMGIYHALTGGMSNSSAVTAAAQAGQYWNDKLMDVIPQLAQDAYQRYVKEFEMDRAALSDILDVDTHLFDREYKVNRDTIADFKNAQDAASERDKAVAEANYKREKEEADRAAAAEKWQTELGYEREKDTEDRRVQEAQNRWTQAFKLYQETGTVPTEEIAEILGIPVGSVTAQMKMLFKRLASEAEQTEKKHQNDIEMENLGHSNTMKEIYAKK